MTGSSSTGLAWAAAKAVSRQDAQGLSAAALRKAMMADVSKLPAYAGVERGDEGYALYRISKVIPAPAPSKEDAAKARERYEREAGAAQLDAYLFSLRARAKIEIRPENLEAK